MPKKPRSSGPVRNGIRLHRHDRSSPAAHGGAARGSDEGADQLRVLLARRGLDAGGDVDARRAGRCGSPCRHWRARGRPKGGRADRLEILQDRPVEDAPLPPGGAASLGGLASRRSRSATAGSGAPGKIARIADADRLMIAAGEALFQRADPVGRFVAMELQPVRPHALDDRPRPRSFRSTVKATISARPRARARAPSPFRG